MKRLTHAGRFRTYLLAAADLGAKRESVHALIERRQRVYVVADDLQVVNGHPEFFFIGSINTRSISRSRQSARDGEQVCDGPRTVELLPKVCCRTLQAVAKFVIASEYRGELSARVRHVPFFTRPEPESHRHGPLQRPIEQRRRRSQRGSDHSPDATGRVVPPRAVVTSFGERARGRAG